MERVKPPFPPVHKNQKQKQIKCPVTHWVLITCFCFSHSLCLGQTGLHIFTWSSRDAYTSGSVSKDDILLVFWGLAVHCEFSVPVEISLKGEISLALFRLTIRVSGERKPTHPWGIRHRLPGSALIVTHWVASPVNDGSKHLCHVTVGVLRPLTSSLTNKGQLKLNPQSFPSAVSGYNYYADISRTGRRIGEWRELTFECLFCARTYSKPIRIYICHIFNSHPQVQ